MQLLEKHFTVTVARIQGNDDIHREAFDLVIEKYV